MRVFCASFCLFLLMLCVGVGVGFCSGVVWGFVVFWFCACICRVLCCCLVTFRFVFV